MQLTEEEMHGDETFDECAAFEFRPENIAPVYYNRAHFLTSQVTTSINVLLKITPQFSPIFS
jgi:hypothetical protein